MIISYKTDKGSIRPNNEDALIYRTSDNNPEGFDITSYGSLFAVADGMGGHFAGEIASKMACQSVLDYYRLPSITDDNAWDQLNRLYYKINDTVLQRSLRTSDFNGMGTTLSTLIIRKQTAWVAHVGDSRIYLIRDGSMNQITYDHTEVQRMVEQGLFTQQEAAESPLRNVLTQAIGVDNRLNVFTWAETLHRGDMYLLSSDGLYDMIPEKKMFSIIQSNANNLTKSCHKLVDEAIRSGGKDNITVMLVLI
ncbi:MAG: Stp1/IreP family PP2C-type Ser/Thr phosphatase [Candidatus Magnetomorum sp.]|nr:Stp1/IreP family PP2C-type Ser/Thr phosphatase [Candidatus Magnetomorum sp.]